MRWWLAVRHLPRSTAYRDSQEIFTFCAPKSQRRLLTLRVHLRPRFAKRGKHWETIGLTTDRSRSSTIFNRNGTSDCKPPLSGRQSIFSVLAEATFFALNYSSFVIVALVLTIVSRWRRVLKIWTICSHGSSSSMPLLSGQSTSVQFLPI